MYHWPGLDELEMIVTLCDNRFNKKKKREKCNCTVVIVAREERGENI